MATKNSTRSTNRTAAGTAPAKHDGRAAAKSLLHTLLRLNSKRDAPVGSRNATKTAIKAAAALPEQELDRFAEVIADWLSTTALGSGISMGGYFSKDVDAEGGAV